MICQCAKFVSIPGISTRILTLTCDKCKSKAQEMIDSGQIKDDDGAIVVSNSDLQKNLM